MFSVFHDRLCPYIIFALQNSQISLQIPNNHAMPDRISVKSQKKEHYEVQ